MPMVLSGWGGNSNLPAAADDFTHWSATRLRLFYPLHAWSMWDGSVYIGVSTPPGGEELEFVDLDEATPLYFDATVFSLYNKRDGVLVANVNPIPPPWTPAPPPTTPPPPTTSLPFTGTTTTSTSTTTTCPEDEYCLEHCDDQYCVVSESGTGCYRTIPVNRIPGEPCKWEGSGSLEQDPTQCEATMWCDGGVWYVSVHHLPGIYAEWTCIYSKVVDKDNPCPEGTYTRSPDCSPQQSGYTIEVLPPPDCVTCVPEGKKYYCVILPGVPGSWSCLGEVMPHMFELENMGDCNWYYLTSPIAGNPNQLVSLWLTFDECVWFVKISRWQVEPPDFHSATYTFPYDGEWCPPGDSDLYTWDSGDCEIMPSYVVVYDERCPTTTTLAPPSTTSTTAAPPPTTTSTTPLPAPSTTSPPPCPEDCEVCDDDNTVWGTVSNVTGECGGFAFQECSRANAPVGLIRDEADGCHWRGIAALALHELYCDGDTWYYDVEGGYGCVRFTASPLANGCPPTAEAAWTPDVAYSTCNVLGATLSLSWD